MLVLVLMLISTLLLSLLAPLLPPELLHHTLHLLLLSVDGHTDHVTQEDQGEGQTVKLKYVTLEYNSYNTCLLTDCRG